MDRNLILAMALSLAVFSAWLAWEEHNRVPVAAVAVGEAEVRGVAEAVAPTGAPGAPADSEPEAAPPVVVAAGDTAGVSPWRGQLEDALVVAELDNRGATLSGWRLKEYFETAKREHNLDLIAPSGEPSRVLATPFTELGLGDLSEALYEVESQSAEAITFVLHRAGFTIRKTYSKSAEPGYGLELAIEIVNGTDRSIAPGFEMVWPAETNALRDFSALALIAIADGSAKRKPVVGLGQPGMLKRFFGDGQAEAPEPLRPVEWAGIDLSYFAGVISAKDGGEAEALFVPREKGHSGAMRLLHGPQEIAPGAKLSRHYVTFLGPKEPDLLKGLGGSLPALINTGYSWVAPLTSFFGWALHLLHDFVPNYGLAIILITVLVRVGTWPIMARQMKSAERMRELMPRIKEIQEKHKDDKQRQSEETFKLYRETGVNPLGGCLPMVLQLPVFIGLFYALQSSIDLRHAPFVWWINDLSSPATFFTMPVIDFPVRLLPILMGASMYVQQKMTPQTGMDPAQARMMSIMMPGMMLVISYGFPAGLVLYWLVSNLLGIGHQLLVRRQMQASKGTNAA